MIGNNLRNAIAAVETSERDPGVLRTTFEGLASEELRSRRAAAWWYVSRTMCYQRSTDLSRQVSEIRTAIQLERRYSRRQLFTIFANRFYFGGDVIGIESASQHFFQKNPSGLTVAEASLIAGIMKNPSYYSPLKHPDRALLRRNEVIDAMIGKGTITAAQGEAAKGTSLGIAAQVSATSP
jgi:penicillin-binding protein 1A